MYRKTLFAALFVSVMLTACVHKPADSYTWRSRCLEGVIQQCKARGLGYTNHSAICQNALLHGIYTLPPEQLAYCKQQEDAKAKSQGKF